MTPPAVANGLEATSHSPGTNGGPNHPNAAAAYRTTSAGGPRAGELLLTNGDIYSGTLLPGGNIPEGVGRYVWSSGRSCVYEGWWRRGTRHGQGRTLWPSGAVHEGEYSAGYMDGEGTYVGGPGSSSSSYKGGWKLDRKHGHGVQTYCNGDMYEGPWVQGKMEGRVCRYTWADGSTYVGAMRSGLMSGKGVLTWSATGDSFQGNWLDGAMHGHGLYTWQDGGRYVGTWTRGFKDGKGTFYPKCSWVPAAHELYIDGLRKRGVLPDISNILQHHADQEPVAGGASFLSRRNLSFEQRPPSKKRPSLQRRWSIGVAMERIARHEPGAGGSDETNGCEDTAADSTNSFPILEREYAQGVLISEVVLNHKSFPEPSKKLRRRQSKMMRDVKRPGEAIIKGHRSYDLMLCLQLGIRYTVGKITPIQRREVRASDYGHGLPLHITL